MTVGVLDLVLNAGPVAKFVLVVLAIFSIVCWALIIEKWWQFRRIRLESMRFLRAFREGRRFSVVYGAARKHRESPLAQLYSSAYQEAGGRARAGRGARHAALRVGRDLPDGALPALPGHDRQRLPVHRAVRHGLGHHGVVPRDRRPGFGQPRRGGARHLGSAHRHRRRPRRRHPGSHRVQLLREPREALGRRDGGVQPGPPEPLPPPGSEGREAGEKWPLISIRSAASAAGASAPRCRRSTSFPWWTSSSSSS